MHYKTDQMGFWKKVKELLGTNATAPVENVFRYGTNILLKTQDSVDEINNFFAGDGERIVNEIPSRPCSLLGPEVKDTRWNYFV